jgi:hypothetical protein
MGSFGYYVRTRKESQVGDSYGAIAGIGLLAGFVMMGIGLVKMAYYSPTSKEIKNPPAIVKPVDSDSRVNEGNLPKIIDSEK